MSWSSRLTIRACAFLMLLAGAALSSSPPVAAAAATAYVGAIGDGTAVVADCAAQANTDCTLRDAIAAAGGAGATVRFGTNFPAGAQTITPGTGAGQGALTVTNCTVSGNVTAGYGGGIRNDGTVTVVGSTFTGNTAGSHGGGVDNGGILTVTNSTFTGNSASGGGGIENELDGTLTVTSSTFSGNSANNGGGISNHGESTVTLTNTIVAASPSGGDLYGGFGGNNNLIDDNGGTLSGSNNLTNTPARLGPLADNGGPTQTLTLLPGSPALDAGATVGSGPAGNPVPAADQRGKPRVGVPDIGAFEFDDPTVVTRVAVTGAPASGTIRVGETVQLHATATYGDGHQADVTTTATWTSSVGQVVGVDSAGKATGTTAGAATITASIGGKQGQAALTVSPPTLTGVQPAPAPANRPSGASTGGAGSPAPVPTGRSAG